MSETALLLRRTGMDAIAFAGLAVGLIGGTLLMIDAARQADAGAPREAS